NLAEVSLGMLAKERAGRDEVKQYAQKLIEDHSKANRELGLIAKQAKLAITAALDKEHRALADKLRKLEGSEFDRVYLRHMVEGHQKALALLEAQASSGENRDLRAYAEKTVPVVREHLKRAEQLAGKGAKDSER